MHLLALGPDAAAAELQQIKGIGPFYSSLIVIRGTGFADVLPVAEPQALALAGRLYDLDGPVSAERLAELAEPWKPLRTWAVVLIRAAGPRLLGDDPAASTASAAPRGRPLRSAERSDRPAAQRDDRRPREDASRIERPVPTPAPSPEHRCPAPAPPATAMGHCR